jgi:hypothetical protein
MSITRRIEKLEGDFAAEGDLDRAHRAAFARAEIPERDYPAVRDEYLARGEIPSVLYRHNDGRCVNTGVSRSPDDPPETNQPDTTHPAFTHDNIHSRD